MTLSDLDRLPDTGEELEAIAKALSIDPAKALRLGKDANEKTIKSMDLTRYRFVVFATHGLVPPQLGLSQPAIALTAPKVANVDGDGLLTMEEVLGLKLDADWVVLSACNTGAGAVEGAEAVSGLGRAFFYAGTRALLLTNWEVEFAVGARPREGDVRHIGVGPENQSRGSSAALRCRTHGWTGLRARRWNGGAYLCPPVFLGRLFHRWGRRDRQCGALIAPCRLPEALDGSGFFAPDCGTLRETSN